jgi:hypothetical protein
VTDPRSGDNGPSWYPEDHDPGTGTYADFTHADVCAGSTRDNPHLWDDAAPGACRTCDRRRTET